MGKAPKIAAPEENPKTKQHLGTFSAPPPLCLGDPYRLKQERSDRTIGKQFSASQLKHQTSRIFPGTLEPPKMLWSEQKDKYIDKTTYRNTVPPEKKKKGFMSGDFPRRDEFSNTIRTSQLREVLKREGKANKKATEEREERTTAHKTANAILEDQHKHTDTHLPAPPLFDVVYRIPEASLKLARDDRQAGLHYKKQRQAMVLSQSGAVLEEKPKRIEGDAAWVNISLHGRPVNLLVAPTGEVLARKAQDSGKHGGGDL